MREALGVSSGRAFVVSVSCWLLAVVTTVLVKITTLYPLIQRTHHGASLQRVTRIALFV